MVEFKLDDHGFTWVAHHHTQSWAGYLYRRNAIGRESNHNLSDGFVDIVFAPEGRDSSAMTDRDQTLIQWFLDNEPSVSISVKAAIIQEYPRLQRDYGYGAAERAEYMPDFATPNELERLIGLRAVNIHQIDKHSIPYMGFEFDCTWDDEHGLGVLMHGIRAVEVGGADTAILLWIAERDALVG